MNAPSRADPLSKQRTLFASHPPEEPLSRLLDDPVDAAASGFDLDNIPKGKCMDTSDTNVATMSIRLPTFNTLASSSAISGVVSYILCVVCHFCALSLNSEEHHPPFCASSGLIPFTASIVIVCVLFAILCLVKKHLLSDIMLVLWYNYRKL